MLQKGKIKSTVGASKLSAPLCKSDPDLNIAPFRNVKSNQNVNRWIFSETNTHCAITRFSVSLTWGDMSEMANKWLLREGEALIKYFSIRWSERRNNFGQKSCSNILVKLIKVITKNIWTLRILQKSASAWINYS